MEAGPDGRASCSSLDSAGKAVRTEGTRELHGSEGRQLGTEDGASREPGAVRSASSVDSFRQSLDTSTGEINTSGTRSRGVIGPSDNHIELPERHDCAMSLASL